MFIFLRFISYQACIAFLSYKTVLFLLYKYHAEGVYLLPSSIALSGVEMCLVNAMSRELTLKKFLTPIKAEYDVSLGLSAYIGDDDH